jgi:hypothetical protein
MSRKASRPPRIAPLQRVVAVPITDPAERAALDKLRKRQKRKSNRQSAKFNRGGNHPGSNATAKKRA